MVGVYGISIIVQSEKHPRYVDERIEAFLQKFHDILVSMKEEEFNTHISAVITKLTEKDKTIIQRSNRYWTEIYNQSYIFTRGK